MPAIPLKIHTLSLGHSSSCHRSAGPISGFDQLRAQWCIHSDKLASIFPRLPDGDVQFTAFCSVSLFYLTLRAPEKLQLYGLYVYYVAHNCDFGMLRVKCIML